MNRLKSYRQSIGLSQYELSEATGVPRYVIQLCETGTRLPTYEHCQKLNDFFRKNIFKVQGKVASNEHIKK